MPALIDFCTRRFEKIRLLDFEVGKGFRLPTGFMRQSIPNQSQIEGSKLKHENK